MTFPAVLKRSLARLMTVGLLSAVATGFGPAATSANGSGDQERNADGCRLAEDSGIQHVISITFDNTHFTRDNPNVPSDLEQMPNLLNFIKDNGTLDINHHTPLISHTATDILTSLTGVYGDRHGVPVSNSFRYFNPDGTSNLGVAFAYWTAPIFDPTTRTPTDTKFNMLTAEGKNAPAPWVPFTRAGCNVGSVATANTILENTGIDIPTVFGAGSSQAQEVKDNPGQAFADFVGIGVHCASGSALCSSAHGGRADVLPQEPGGYNGFQALFGHKYVAPQVSARPLTDLDGNVIKDAAGHVGFPGFDGMSASVSLSYVAALQEHGVPVTYAYISDAHDKHPTGPAFGPGEAGYVAALKAYDAAFAKFFIRLADHGINKRNTLFVFTADEGDHFSGGTPTPAGCDGVNIPCTFSRVTCPATNPPSCPSDNIGETNANFAGLLKTQQGISTPFKVHSDSAPTVYITGNPKRTLPVARDFERAAGKLVGTDPQTGNSEQIMTAMADPVEMNLLHMVTADPARTPTFTYFARPEYFLFAAGLSCTTASPCITQNPGFAWNHGDFQPEIVNTWLGLVGPGVRHLGTTSDLWSDHTDIRPTLLALTGLRDDYASDGRVLVEALKGEGLAKSLGEKRGLFIKLAQVYKQINAPVGQLGLATLARSTQAVQGDDATYTTIENQLVTLNARRDSIAGEMIAMLNAAAFDGTSINAEQARDLIQQGEDLLGQGEDQQGD